MQKSVEKAWLKSLSASFLFPSPSFIELKGAPPSPIKAAKEDRINVIGKQTPRLAKASVPIDSIPETKIRSMKL